MKTFKSIYAILALLLWAGCVGAGYAQSLIHQKGRAYIEQRGEQWDVDTTKIIVHIDTTVVCPADWKVNKLGFTMIPVPKNVRIESFMDSLQRLPYIRLAEYNVCGKPAAFNDTYYSNQWYYTSYDFEQLVANVPNSHRDIVIIEKP